MQAFPHHYHATAQDNGEGPVNVSCDEFPAISTQPPTQFGGVGGAWSPEDLLMAAIADCFCFSFRAISRASKLEWNDLSVTAEGELDRVERVTKFTKVVVKAKLVVPAGTDETKAMRLLEKAEGACLITNSMNAELSLQAEVVSA
ncbi:MAG: OsmC family protein [Granulosicoccaceae bacterium]